MDNSNSTPKNWFKKHKASLLIILVGLLVLTITSIYNNSYEIDSMKMLAFYTGTFLCILGAIMFTMKKKWVITANLVIVVFLLLLVEIGCYFALGMPSTYNKKFSVPNLPENHIGRQIGTVPYNDSVYHKIKTNGNDTVFDVLYSIDQHYRRNTPDFDSSKSEYALFFGCSIAFGEGLEDNQTLAHHYQDVSGNYNCYNYSYPGYGTNHMLARLKFHHLPDQVSEQEGMAFYIFFWDHIYRAIGSMQRYCGWLSNAPYYKFEDGKLVRDRMFKDGRYWLSKVYEKVHQLSLIKYFEINFPLQLNDKHFDLISEMILESKKEYNTQFGNDKFILVVYPNYKKYTDEEMERFKYFLDKKGIKYIDLSTFIEYSGKYSLNGDPHPNSNTNLILAEELLRIVKEKELDK